MSVDWLMLSMLVLAVMLGFALGSWSRRSKSRAERAQTFDQRCLGGLNSLLLDRSGEAVDTLIDALEVTEQTLDTHLALGALLRRKGEMAQAIAVHQRLLAVSGVEFRQRQKVQYELALNYVAAGLFDRAESILLELESAAPSALREQCLQVLVEIYQSEKEWRQAIDIVARMTVKRLFGVSLRQLKAHYCCELAELARARGDWRDFLSLLSEASGHDRAGLRHNWLRVDFELRQRRFSEAVSIIKRQVSADATVLPLLGEVLVQCYVGLGRPAKLRDYLERLLENPVYAGHGAAFVVALARDIAVSEGAEVAQDFLLWQLREHGGLPILAEVWSGLDVVGAAESVAVLDEALARVVSYSCGGCGFSGAELHWMCPSCKQWSTFGWVDAPLVSRG